MDLYVIPRPSAWATTQDLEAVGAKSRRIGEEEMSDSVRWIRTYVVDEADGRLGVFCVYEAKDVASLREHSRRVGMPCPQVYPVAKTVLNRPDPVQRFETTRVHQHS